MKLLPLTLILLCGLIATNCLAETLPNGIDVDRLANAIYKAENSKAHPYGIMVKYKHTTPRQACINTIKHALRDYQRLPSHSKRCFIAFLGARYCPTQGNGLRPAERALNRFWVPNVTKLYNKGA